MDRDFHGVWQIPITYGRTLPKSIDIYNTKNKNIKQLNRYNLTLELWKKALLEDKDVML